MNIIAPATALKLKNEPMPAPNPNHNPFYPDKKLLHIEDLSLCAGSECVLTHFNLELHTGEIICLLGPSGCGKTTTLRAIAGFVKPTRGTIRLEDEIVTSPKLVIPPEKRQVGMIFQDHALFPHLTVERNISFGLNHLDPEERAKRVKYYSELVHIESYSDKYPHELSGGQRQRVAIARALAPHPRLLLMDEPFSNLDIHLRTELQREMLAVLRKEKITAIIVTHDQEEAFAMGDRIGLLAHGRLQQISTPYELYHEPASRFVANFIGLGSFINARVIDEYQLETPTGIITSTTPLNWPKDHRVELLLRPDDILPEPQSELRVIVEHKIFKGASTFYRLRLNPTVTLDAIFPSHHDYEKGENIGISIVADHVVAFEK